MENPDINNDIPNNLPVYGGDIIYITCGNTDCIYYDMEMIGGDITNNLLNNNDESVVIDFMFNDINDYTITYSNNNTIFNDSIN